MRGHVAVGAAVILFAGAAHGQVPSATETAERLVGNTFRCNQLGGRTTGDVFTVKFETGYRLSRNTLSGPLGAGSSTGRWTLEPDGETLRLKMIYDRAGWGEQSARLALTEAGFEQFTMRDGQRIPYMSCVRQ